MYAYLEVAIKNIATKLCFFVNKIYVCVVVNFLSQVIFIFPLFWGMVIYANEFETKEKQKLPEIKINCNMYIETCIKRTTSGPSLVSDK